MLLLEMRAGAPLVCGMCAEAAEYREDIILRFGVLLIYCDAFASVMLCAAVDCLFYSFSLINKNKKKQKTQTHACETTSWGIHLQWDTVPWRFWSNCTEILALRAEPCADEVGGARALHLPVLTFPTLLSQHL